ncbi:hypothetical protein L9F63_006595, partial [Diploptera punctata]
VLRVFVLTIETTSVSCVDAGLEEEEQKINFIAVVTRCKFGLRNDNLIMCQRLSCPDK